MSSRVVLITERTGFTQAWSGALERAGLQVDVIGHDDFAGAIVRDGVAIFDASWDGYDEDELLAAVGFARAKGAQPVAVVPTTDKFSNVDALLHDVCSGLVTTDGNAPRIANVLARRLDDKRGQRFEYLTVSPDGGDFLAIFGDGASMLLPRPVATGDDGSEVGSIDIADDATDATVTLASGTSLRLSAHQIAKQFGATRIAHANGNGLDPADIDGVRLGARLKQLRVAAGLTQAELARRTGIHRPNIARVEAGRHTPSLETIARLASAIGVPTTRVFAED